MMLEWELSPLSRLGSGNQNNIGILEVVGVLPIVDTEREMAHVLLRTVQMNTVWSFQPNCQVFPEDEVLLLIERIR